MEVINVVEQGSVIKKTDIHFCIFKEGVLNERNKTGTHWRC